MLLLQVPGADASAQGWMLVLEVAVFQVPLFLAPGHLGGLWTLWLGGSLVQDVGGGGPLCRGPESPCQV